jgi:hypothetical protein
MRIFAALGAAIIVGACASQSYSDLPVGMQTVAVTGTVAVGVHDMRPYIVNKNKDESVAGLQRGGFGNPFDLKTANGAPLAIEMRDSLMKALKARGASPVPVVIAVADSPLEARVKLLDHKARRSVLVTLREWKTDTQMRTDFVYDTTVSVFDERGSEVASHTQKGLDALGFSQAGGETITKATAAKLDALFADPLIAAALR